MADSTLLTTTVTPDMSDKYIYAYKLDTWSKDQKAKIFGLEGATSGTNTKTVTTTATKTVAIKTLGSANQQRTVLAYFQVNDGIHQDMKMAWRHNIPVHLYRLNLNRVSGEKGARIAECEYSQTIIGTLPDTEGLAGIMQASLAFEVQGYAQDGSISETEFEDGAFDNAQALYEFLKPTEVGGATTDEVSARTPTAKQYAAADSAAGGTTPPTSNTHS